MTRPWQLMARELAQQSNPRKIRDLSNELNLAMAEQHTRTTVHLPDKPEGEPSHEPSV